VPSKYEQNNVNFCDKIWTFDGTHYRHRPIYAVGDHVGRLCIHGDGPIGSTRPAVEFVLIVRSWILCEHATSVVGTLPVKSHLVDETIETLTWLESSWKELKGPSLLKVLA
jgi:hypothetical protein